MFHILLVEHNVVNQRLSLRLLEKRGYQVTAVADGPEVLAAIARQRFDLVLMDIQLPGMDGLEITSIIRQQEVLSGGRLTIVAMTANCATGDEDCYLNAGMGCLNAGMDGYIPKPFEPSLLFDTVERFSRPISAASA